MSASPVPVLDSEPLEADAASGDEGRSLWQDARERFLRNRVAMASLLFFAFIFFISFALPPFLQDPNQVDPLNKNAPASAEHWFGTDHIGRDLFARTIQGGQVSLLVALITTAVSVSIGLFWGAVAGYAGGKTDSIMMRVVDVLYALPFLVIVILLSLFLGELTGEITLPEGDFWEAVAPFMNLVPLFLAIGALSWLTVARIVRAQVLSIKNQDFVQAARSLGLSDGKILFRHIIPNVLGPVIVYTTLAVPGIMLFEATLSFLGLGVKPPFATWGSLIKEGAERMEDIPGLLFYPALFFSTTLFALNFIGDGLRDALDVRASKD